MNRFGPKRHTQDVIDAVIVEVVWAGACPKQVAHNMKISMWQVYGILRRNGYVSTKFWVKK